jgi:diguanylate cyclase (GGDEF)-like protein/PAS domain S-box-containing protein
MGDRIDTLIVEDSPDDAELAVRALRGAGLDVDHLRVETIESLDEALRDREWDLVISDFSLPKMDARKALELVRRVDPDVPFIIVSGTIGEERAVAAMRAGAQDYILKGEGLERLPPAVEREVREASNRRHRRQADEARREAEQEVRILASIVESSADAMISMTLRGEVLSWNRGAENAFGYSAGEMMGAGCMRIVHERQQAQMSDALARVARGESVAGQETTGLRRDGTSIDLSVTISPIYDEGGRVIGASTVARDITDRKRVESRLAYLADHDLLTGLYNRRRFDEELTREIPLAQRSEHGGAALVLGLDNFKLLNDTLGHHTGDELLRRVAELLSETLDDVDIVARVGGDEFAILLREGSPERVARELLDAIKGEPLVGGEQPVRITASVGIAPLAGAVTSEELLTHADLAMYEAKDDGGDSLAVFEPTRHRRELLGERLQMAERIRRAIDEGSFEVYCQPILDVTADAVSQHELLVRMLDEEGGVISPADFLPIAERFGLIVAIDRWMVLRAIELVAEQSEQGRRICVEVNLSAGSMVDADLFNEIERAIGESGIDPAQLIFEVTETTAIENLGDAKRLAERLIQLGCRFALDDFGAGFGSFYYLKHLPFDFLKIDGDFIRRLPVNPTDQSMVEAIVQVCHQLEKRTIAEFVEDQATLDLLREYGVDFAQGYHVGRPESAAKTFA